MSMSQWSNWMRTRKIFWTIVTAIADMIGLYSTLLIALWTLSGERLWFVALWVNLLPGAFYPLLFAFIIVIFTRKTHTIALLLLPILTCIIMYGGRFLPVRQQADSLGQSISVMTYNMMVNTRDINSFNNILLDVDADIVALQEVHPDMLALITAAQSERYPYPIPSTDTILDDSYKGRMLLSRYPVIDSENVPSLHPDHMLAQRVVLDVNGQHVTVFNLHLILPVLQNGFSSVNRDSDLAMLFELLRNEPLATQPYILMGDFNMSDAVSVHNTFIDELGLVDSFAAAGYGFGVTYPNFDTIVPALGWIPTLIRLDYAFVSPSFVPIEARVIREGVSDHYPLWVRLQMKGSADD